jgi:hypothetical protein
MVLTIKLVNGIGKELFQKSHDIRLASEIAKLGGGNVFLPPNSSGNDRREIAARELEKPQVHIEGNKVFAKKDRPFAVEIRVKGPQDKEAKPRTPICDAKGNPFVEIHKGEIYEVVLCNAAKHETGCTVTIDGIDAFAFCDDKDAQGKVKYSHYIVNPKTEAPVRGWFKTVDPKGPSSLSFLVTEYGKGAHSSLKAKGKTGVITVTFAASSTDPKILPDGEGSKDVKELETGFGPPNKEDVKEVNRFFGVVRDVISIRYKRDD